MLFFLFPDAELERLFDRLGYEFSPDIARRTIEYYDRRTSHGSTLSLIVHAGVLAGIDPESSWERFLAALESDIGDIQGGTTPEGIHTGVMAGTLDLVQRIYLGAEIRDGVVFFDPRLPERLDGLSLPMQFRGTPLRVSIEGSELTVEALDRRLHPARQGRRRPTTSASSAPAKRCTFTLGRAGRLRVASRECARDFAARSSTWTACSSTRRTSEPGATRCGS